MSRPVNQSESSTFVPSSLDSANSSYAGVSTTYTIDYGLKGYNENTSYYAAFYLNTGSNAETTIYYNFDCSSIPSGATINSVSCTARSATSQTSTRRIASATLQLCSGTTTKGSSTSTLSTTATNYNLSVGSWTRSELDNIKIKCYAQRGTSNTGTQYEFRFYGATLTVNYSISGTEYEVSITNNSLTTTTSPSTTQYVFQGGSQEITITTSDINSISVTDNNVDVTSSIIQHSIPGQSDTVTFVPSGYTNETNTTNSGNYQYTNAYKAATTSGTYARWEVAGNASFSIYYTFSITGIPSNAIITSVQVEAALRYSSQSVSGSFTEDVQLYNGTTPMGEPLHFVTNGNSDIAMSLQTISNTGSWTPQTLQNLRFVMSGSNGATSARRIYLNGVTLTVSYGIPSGEYYYTYTISNISADHAIVIEDVAPGFVLTCTDNSTLGDITPTGTQSVEEGDDVVYSLSSSDFSLIKLTDNGVDVTSQIVHSQSSGSGSPVFVPSSYVYSKPTGATGVVIDTIQNGSNAYTNTSSYTYATLLSFEGGSNWAAFYISVSGIPEGAIIDSVTCKVKIRYLLTSSNNSVQLYSGNTAKGTPTSLTYNQTFNDYLNIGTWTAEELQDVRLYICVPGQNQSQGMECAYVYGAELTVTYHSIAGHTYTISNVSAPHTLVLSDQPYYVLTCTDNSTNGDIVPTGTRNVVEGGNAVYTLTSSDFSTLRLTDNGVDVTNQIVYSSTTSSGSPMFVPSGYTNGNPGFTVSDVSNGYKDTSSYASYATLEIPANSTCYGSFIISVSGIPSGAIIDSVSCKVSALKRGNDTVTTYTIQLYSGNTPKGTASSISGSNQVRTVNLETGAWTVEELQDVRLLITGTNKSTNSSFSYLFYGAEFTVTYHSTQGYTYNILNVSAPHTIVLEDSNDRVYIKVNGNFVQVEAVYKKINGVWVEQSDMSSLFDNNHIYVTG